MQVRPWLVIVGLFVATTALAGAAGSAATAAVGTWLAPPSSFDAPRVAATVDVGDAGAAAADGDVEDGLRGGSPTDDDEPPAAGPPSQQTYVDRILARNLFDPSAIGRPRDPAAAAADAEPAFEKVEVDVVATVVAVPTRYSSALIARKDPEAPLIGYGVGDTLDAATIQAIRSGEVEVVYPDGTVDTWAIGTRKTVEKKKKKRRRRRRRRRRGKYVSAIDRVGGTTWRIDRSKVRGLMNDPAALGRMARARPHHDAKGNVVGFRLSRVRRGRAARAMGLRSGDVVTEVNGKKLTSLQDAMSLMGQFNSASQLQVGLLRRGKKRTHTYQLE